jgi:hypothetical protein
MEIVRSNTTAVVAALEISYYCGCVDKLTVETTSLVVKIVDVEVGGKSMRVFTNLLVYVICSTDGAIVHFFSSSFHTDTHTRYVYHRNSSHSTRGRTKLLHVNDDH